MQQASRQLAAKTTVQISLKSSPLHTSQRTYIAKYTHFHKWKPSKQPTSKQLEARAERQANRIITPEQYAKVKKPFDFPVFSRPSVELRKPTQPMIIKDLRRIELDRLKALPRETVPFKVGDRIAVTALLCMTEAKTQVYKGTVTQRVRGTGLHGRFTIRNNTEGSNYEITFPYWSPFLRKVEMIEKENFPLPGKTKLKNYYRNLPEDHPANKML